MRLDIFTPTTEEVPLGRLLGHINHLDINLARNTILIEYTDMGGHYQRGEYEIAQLFRGRVPEFLFTAPPDNPDEQDVRATGPGLWVPIGEITLKYPDQENQLAESRLVPNMGINQSEFPANSISPEDIAFSSEASRNISNDVRPGQYDDNAPLRVGSDRAATKSPLGTAPQDPLAAMDQKLDYPEFRDKSAVEANVESGERPNERQDIISSNKSINKDSNR